MEDDGFSMCGICCKLLAKTKINVNRPFDVPDSEDVIKISDALYYLAPEGNLRIFEQMEICSSCLEKLRSAYKFKYDCLSAEKAISKYLQENQLLLADPSEDHSSKEISDVTPPPKQPESEDSPLESNKNGDTAQKAKDVSVRLDNQQILEKTCAKMAETSHLNKTVKDRTDVTNQERTKDSLLPNPSINSGNIAVKTEQTCEPEVVSDEEKIREQTNLDPQQLSLHERAGLWKDKLAQHLNAGRTTPEKGLNVGKRGQAIKYIIPKQGKNSYRYTIGKATGLSEDNLPQQSSVNSKNVSTVNTSNNADDTGNITCTEATESEVEPPRSLSGTTNLFNDTKCQNTNIDKEPDVDKSNTVGESGESAQGEVVRIKQEKDTEPSELTFCDTTGLFKNNQNQYFDAEGNLIEPSDLEQEAQKALEKVNSIFTEPILNSEPFQPVNTVNNELVQVPPLAPLTPMGLTANAGILTPVTVTEDNGVISITPVGDAVKNSFITLDNPFMLDDMIDIKEEPLERYDFDTIGTDEDTISAPETMLQDCELGGTDEYVDIPEFVMVNKNGEDEQNLKQMQPAVLEKKLFGDAGVSGLIGVPIIEGNMLPVQDASPVCSSPGQSRKRMYKK